MKTLGSRIRNLTLADALRSYTELTSLPLTRCPNPGLSRVGLKTLDYFFLDHRLKARTRSHLSFYEAMQDPKQVAFLTELVHRYKAGLKINYDNADELLRHQYSVFQLYYGTINQFRPAVARWIYCKLKPRHGILDFSAGWGGRCLAAMSLGIPYVGIDANKNLAPTYTAMINTLPHTADTRMIFAPSETVDFSQFTYDLVFTSPPYFMIEEYERMPAYGSKEAFLTKFFRPVVVAAWQHLQPGGHMALNMPHEMYMAVRDLLPPVTSRLQMPIHDRHAQNASLGRAFTTKKRHELIYIWRKTDRHTNTKSRTLKKSKGHKHTTLKKSH